MPPAAAIRPVTPRLIGLDSFSTPDPRPLRILLVDDHAIVREGLQQILRETFPAARFAEAANSRQALEQLHQFPWDVVLLDITLPGRSGLEVLCEIRKLRPRTRVLVLTMHPEDQYALRALQLGATGYLTKDKASTELVGALNRALAGGKYVSDALAESLVTKLQAPAMKRPHETLSNREYETLVRIGSGKSVKEIAADLALSVKTISTYRTRVLRKMRFKTSADLIRYAMRERLVD